MIILPETKILAPLFCFSKKRLFEEIAQCAASIIDTDSDDIVEALNKRETLGSTVFYPGISIPHTVFEGKTPSFAILCILNKPITFNSIDADEQLIDIAFSMFFNKKDNVEKSEALLQNITKVLSNNDLLNSLRLAKNEIKKIEIILNQIDILLDSSQHIIVDTIMINEN